MKMRDLINLVEDVQLQITGEDLAWFRGSVLTTYDSDPLIVYHGSGQNFDRFEHGHTNGFSNPRRGFYFTDDEAVASEFGQVRAFLLRLTKPANFIEGEGDDVVAAVMRQDPELAGQMRRRVEAEYGDDRVTGGRIGRLGLLQTDEFVRSLERLGYDGMMFDDALGHATYFDSYVAFNADQIRLLRPAGT